MPDSSIILMGGSGVDGVKNDVWRSTDNGATWTQLTNGPTGWTARVGHSSVAMPDGRIVLTGGFDGANPKNDVWEFMPAQSSEQNPFYMYMQPGSYDVALYVHNSGGYSGMRKTHYITVAGGPSITPVANFAANITFGPAPLTVQFSDTSTGAPTSWTWSFRYPEFSSPWDPYNQQNPVYVYNEPGVYNVSLNVTNSAGSNQTVINYFIVVTSPSEGYTITSLPFDINQSVVQQYGTKYKLESDLTLNPGLDVYGIRMHDVTGITLDGKDHLLHGNSNPTGAPGIIMMNVTDCNVTNFGVDLWGPGIIFQNITSGNISNNNVYNNQAGINGGFSSNVLVENNHAIANNYAGISLSMVNNSYIRANHANSTINGDGINTWSCSDLIIENNVFGSNARKGMNLGGLNLQILYPGLEC
jgi:PKD repeat protein